MKVRSRPGPAAWVSLLISFWILFLVLFWGSATWPTAAQAQDAEVPATTDSTAAGSAATGSATGSATTGSTAAGGNADGAAPGSYLPATRMVLQPAQLHDASDLKLPPLVVKQERPRGQQAMVWIGGLLVLAAAFLWNRGQRREQKRAASPDASASAPASASAATARDASDPSAAPSSVPPADPSAADPAAKEDRR